MPVITAVMLIGLPLTWLHCAQQREGVGVNTAVDLHSNQNEVNCSDQRMQTAYSLKPYRVNLRLARVRRHVKLLPSPNYKLVWLVN